MNKHPKEFWILLAMPAIILALIFGGLFPLIGFGIVQLGHWADPSKTIINQSQHRIAFNLFEKDESQPDNVTVYFVYTDAWYSVKNKTNFGNLTLGNRYSCLYEGNTTSEYYSNMVGNLTDCTEIPFEFSGYKVMVKTIGNYINSTFG